MAHGLSSVIKRNNGTGVIVHNCQQGSAKPEGKTGIGSRRIFSPQFKLQVLDSYRNDADCKGNQRATARKYGIHRRQIQKWLQVEENLRSSVNNSAKGDDNSRSAMALNAGRQRDDTIRTNTQSLDARWSAGSPPCPARPFAILDYSTKRECCYDYGSNTCSPLASPDPAAPIDLSFKKADRVTPVASPFTPPTPSAVCVYGDVVAPNKRESETDVDVWDLSTKSVKRKCEEVERTSPKPVKLFKPYLDDLGDDCGNNNNNVEDKAYVTSSIGLQATTPPLCCQHLCDSPTYFYNNNNVCCDIKYTTESSYTLHELQPKTYYYPPVSSEYDVRSYCDISYATLKQRQSYSLDFKLSAIDCYYQDSVCKGNQRAVASKYNVHRRQVQKWLKQADELKIKNETQSVR